MLDLDDIQRLSLSKRGGQWCMSASRSGSPGWSVQNQNMVGDLNEYEHGHYPQNVVGDFQLNEYEHGLILDGSLPLSFS